MYKNNKNVIDLHMLKILFSMISAIFRVNVHNMKIINLIDQNFKMAFFKYLSRNIPLKR